MSSEILLIDAGTGNLRSVLKALESLGAKVSLASDPVQLRRGGRVVLPGVGAFGDFMAGLWARNLEQAVIEVVRRGDPLLGICVGMQALFEVGEELGEHPGLGLLPGRAVRFPSLPGLKVPHTGWNQLILQAECPLWKEISSGEFAYFNHSYYCAPHDPAHGVAWTEYGLRFASAVQRENLFGVQFHPEKSQRVGLQILASFLHC